MNLHKDQSDSLEPCKHMESMLNRTADGTAPRWMRWYAKLHASGCSRCESFLTRVTSLIGQLHEMKADIAEPLPEERLSKEHWDSLEAAWAEAEK